MIFMKIGVLGAGLTGLTLGYLLNDLKYDFTIVEKESSIGGLCRSYSENGFTFDIGGSHVLFSKDKQVLDFILSILKDNVVRRRRNTKVFFKGRYVKYPFENGLSDLPKEDNFECLYSFIQTLIKKEKGILKEPANFEEWMYYTFGSGITEKYLLPYNKKIWKHAPSDMGLNLVERIPNPPVEDIIKSSLGISTEGYLHQLYFYYPKYGGIESLVQNLYSPIKSQVITNFEVRNIGCVNNKWYVSDGKKKLVFDKLISTIPITDLVNIVDAIPSEIQALSKRLIYNSIITVGLGISRPKLNDFSWVYVPDEKILFHRISFPSNYSPYVSREGHSAILAEITCKYNDKIWRMSDNEIIDKTIEGLETMNVIAKEDIILKKVFRLKYAYIIYDLQYNATINKLYDFFSDYGIHLVGRFAEFKYLNMDACIKSAKNFIAHHFGKNI